MLTADFLESRMLVPAAPPQRTFQPRADAYPMHLIETWQTATDVPITIRPINAGDMVLERAFLNGLSEQTRYQRLFSTRGLLPGELERLTHIDYQHEMALIATTFVRGIEQQIGVARYVKEADGDCDLAIVIADDWQCGGLGEKLLVSLMQSARLAGIARLTGVTLATNTRMQRLARKLGVELRRDLGDPTLIKLIKVL